MEWAGVVPEVVVVVLVLVLVVHQQVFHLLPRTPGEAALGQNAGEPARDSLEGGRQRPADAFDRDDHVLGQRGGFGRGEGAVHQRRATAARSNRLANVKPPTTSTTSPTRVVISDVVAGGEVLRKPNCTISTGPVSGLNWTIVLYF